MNRPRFQLGPLPNVGALLKQYFFSGLLVVIPLGVIFWLLILVLGALWRLHEIFPEAWRPESFLHNDGAAAVFNLVLTLGFAILLALGISVVGWSSRHYIGRKLIEYVAEIIQKIPVIRSIYSALDQLLKTLAAGGGQQFSRVVYVEYPRKGVWALAFVTGGAKGPAAPPNHLNIYVPTTPNPTSGFHLIVPESDVRESGMAVEDAFRTILSLGIAQPRSPEDGR